MKNIFILFIIMLCLAGCYHPKNTGNNIYATSYRQESFNNEWDKISKRIDYAVKRGDYSVSFMEKLSEGTIYYLRMNGFIVTENNVNLNYNGGNASCSFTTIDWH